MISDQKIYHIDMIKNKAQVKITNVLQNECQFIGLKLSNQYAIKANDKKMNSDNFKNTCSLKNQITIQEK